MIIYIYIYILPLFKFLVESFLSLNSRKTIGHFAFCCHESPSDKSQCSPDAAWFWNVDHDQDESFQRFLKNCWTHEKKTSHLQSCMCQAGAAPKALDLAAMMLKKAGAGDLPFHPVRFIGDPRAEKYQNPGGDYYWVGCGFKIIYTWNCWCLFFFPVFLNELWHVWMMFVFKSPNIFPWWDCVWVKVFERMTKCVHAHHSGEFGCILVPLWVIKIPWSIIRVGGFPPTGHFSRSWWTR